VQASNIEDEVQREVELRRATDLGGV